MVSAARPKRAVALDGPIKMQARHFRHWSRRGHMRFGWSQTSLLLTVLVSGELPDNQRMNRMKQDGKQELACAVWQSANDQSRVEESSVCSPCAVSMATL